ncbi:trna-splicing endonuclease subunit sen2 [Trichoderma arundinaceum]|uniref:tRNA-intron lyase n=1 Tax=Trichoderma arundinaceum TaxID=490622 RepID=A0A395NT83_TRIAR|nr:trna-splicing endonuclease subunit sen2 [Trichoderma arundinaceum]
MAEMQVLTEPPSTGKASPTPKAQAQAQAKDQSQARAQTEAPAPAAQQQKRGPSIHQIYALPAPIRTFPLPVFYPNNPVSLFHVAYAWLGQVFRPPPVEPAVVHQGVWSETTISVHIKDEKSMRALWEQGFYGKGNLSRSEPNWLKREQVQRGLQEAHVSEIFTQQRREERAQAKWERARLEQEAILQTKLEEQRLAESRRLAEKQAAVPISSPRPLAPVGPLELLALPNSAVVVSRLEPAPTPTPFLAPVGPLQILALPNSAADILKSTEVNKENGTLTLSSSSHHGSSTDDSEEPRTPITNETPEIFRDDRSVNSSSDGMGNKTLKRRKSVRFSPTVESATYKASDPPSPNRSPPVLFSQPSQANGNGKSISQTLPPLPLASVPVSDPIINKEHLQLMPEEAFFLSFGLGVLEITDPASGRVLSRQDLFSLFRQYSYFPPRNGPDEPDLEPDDGFLVHYAVYHHFRSLGWVPRAGIKFGVDWLLYARGPVFDHAEFGLIVIPSYSDAWWKNQGKQGPRKPWSWLHSVVRVLSHVTKSLVLIYVDVPPPHKFEEALKDGITEAMKLYKVREVMVKRWSSNRNR